MVFMTIFFAFVGLLIGGPLGAVIAGLFGFYLDRRVTVSLRSEKNHFSHAQCSAQTAFFEATFLWMGRLAKIDGHVSKDEIRFASSIMENMKLSEHLRHQAIALFNRGKYDQGVDEALLRFRNCTNSVNLVRAFLEIQFMIACNNGKMTESKLNVLHRACNILGINEFEFQVLCEQFIGQKSFYGAGDQYNQNAYFKTVTSSSALRKAYATLGVDPNADEATIKRAYRKQMSQHHPDKLVAKGLPESMHDIAKQRAQEIQSAYDVIKKSR